MLDIGEIGKFIVKRETDISYTLSPDDIDLTNYVFLHFNQATRKLNIGEKIEAFLYYDQKKRLCATMEKPLITTKQSGFVEVVNICDGGVFVNIGIAKDILLSNDYLPNNKLAWPQLSEKLPCILKAKKDQLVAKIINKEDLKNLKIEPLSIGTKVVATVCRLLSDGIGLYTNDFQYIYVHKSMMRKKYHLGEIVEVTIININKEGNANGSFIQQKEFARLDDSKLILNYLKTMGGIVHLGNASSPEEIKKFFPMSKSAFKRAVGALYKDKIIIVDDDSIKLINNK